MVTEIKKKIGSIRMDANIIQYFDGKTLKLTTYYLNIKMIYISFVYIFDYMHDSNFQNFLRSEYKFMHVKSH